MLPARGRQIVRPSSKRAWHIILRMPTCVKRPTSSPQSPGSTIRRRPRPTCAAPQRRSCEPLTVFRILLPGIPRLLWKQYLASEAE